MGLGAALFNLLLALLWAGTSVTAREAVDRVPPLAVGGIRFGLAALFMLLWCRWEGVSIALRRQQWSPALVMGLLLFLQIGTFNWGVAWSNSSHATLLVNTYIFWVAAVEHFLMRTVRLTAVQGLGLLIAAGGAALLFLEAPAAPPPAPQTVVGDSSPPAADVAPAPMAAVSARLNLRGEEPLDQVTLAGDLMLALSALLLAVKVLYTQHAVRSIPPGTLILWHDMVGTVLFFAVSLPWERWHPDPWTPSIVLALLYNGLVVSGFCFAAHAWMLRRYSASSVSIFSFATPVFGIVLAVLFRGDPLSGWLILAGVLVAAGIALVNAPGVATDVSEAAPSPSPEESPPGSTAMPRSGGGDRGAHDQPTAPSELRASG